MKATSDLMDKLHKICDETCKGGKAQLDNTKRINEKGNQLEDIFLDLNQGEISRPKTLQGKTKTTGYPDLDYNDSVHNLEAYIEVKLYNQGSEDSTFRSFYMSTIDKITKSKPHILTGFEHKDGKLTGKFHVIDLYDLPLKVKIELNATNNDI